MFIAGSMAEFGSILLLSLFFSRQSSSPGSAIFLLSGFGVVIVLSSLFVRRAWRSPWLARQMKGLDDSSSQLRVRAAVAIMFLFVAVANHLGLEAILGSFLAGALVRVVDRQDLVASEHVRMKLEAIGFGFVVPFFFVTTGITLDVKALFANWSAARELVEFFFVLLAVRGVPALMYRSRFGNRRALVAALMQATSLTFVGVAAHLGRELHKIDASTEAALVMAGLLSVLLFPAIAMALLGRKEAEVIDKEETPTLDYEDELR